MVPKGEIIKEIFAAEDTTLEKLRRVARKAFGVRSNLRKRI
jgi:hypothetical protein